MQEKGEKGERGKGPEPGARPVGAGARGDEKLGTGTGEWGRCRPSPCGLWGMRVGVGGREGISPRCPAEEAGRERDGRGCRLSSLRPSALKTAAESDFRSLENQRNYKRNGTGRPGSRLDRYRKGPRSLLRDSEPPSCHPGGKGADGQGGAAAPARGDALGGSRVAIVSPPPARTRARAGKCRSCYSSFHSFPSQLPSLDAAVGEVRPPGRCALTMPAVRVRVRAAGPVTTRWRAPPRLQPGNTTIFKPAPLTNRKC